MLAVLPVRDLDADSSQPYLAAALTDQLIVDLGRFPELRVIDRRTMMTFRERIHSTSEIAQLLGADAILQATVRRVGDRVHLSVELSGAGDERRRWTHIILSRRDSLRQRKYVTAYGIATVRTTALSPAKMPIPPCIAPTMETAGVTPLTTDDSSCRRRDQPAPAFD